MVLGVTTLEFLPPDPIHAELLFEWRNDEELRRYNPVKKDASVSELRQRLGRSSGDLGVEVEEYSWFARDPATGHIVGSIGLRNWNRTMRTAEIGYSVAKEARGKGFATAMIAECVRRAFTETTLRKLSAYVHEENAPSRKALENSGFALEGVLRNHYLIDDQPANEALYAILREDVADTSSPSAVRSEKNYDVPPRDVIENDALAYLRDRTDFSGCSFFGSLPDISEFPSYSLAQWQEWFRDTAELLLRRTPDDGVTLFFQSDIKREGLWVDKGHLVQSAADRVGASLLWHKILCRAPPDRVTFGRPAYSHLLCFSKGLREAPSFSTPDVVSDQGPRTWVRGTGENAARIACRYVRDHTETRTLVNPFCGEGMILNVANQLGLASVGIERSRKRAERARTLGR